MAASPTTDDHLDDLATLLETDLGLSSRAARTVAESTTLWSLRSGETVALPRDRGLVVITGRISRPSGPTWYRGAVVDSHDLAGTCAVADGPALVAELGTATRARLLRSVADPAAAVRGVGRAPKAVTLAVVCSAGIDSRWLTSQLTALLAGSVSTIRPSHVDKMVGVTGAVEAGTRGDLAISRLLHDRTLEHDLVLLETSRRPDAWSRWAMGSADRIVLAYDDGADAGELARMANLIDHAPLATPRSVLVFGRGSLPTSTTSVLDHFAAEAALHVRIGSTNDLGRAARMLAGCATSLVLSGGGARGFAHLGVYRALCELGVQIDHFVGSSVGSALAATMADEHRPDELDDLIARLFAKAMDYTVPVVAAVKGRAIVRAAASVFGDRDIEDLQRSFRCVSTDLTDGCTHLHRRGSVVHAIRASVAVPGMMPPVPHRGHLLADGGLTNNLPIDVAIEAQPKGRTIAVDVLPSSGLRSRGDYGLSVSGARAIVDRVRSRRLHPPLGSTLMRALALGSGRHHALADDNPDICLLDLDLSGTAMFDFGNVAGPARRGYDQAMPLLEAWLSDQQSRSDERTHRVAPDRP